MLLVYAGLLNMGQCLCVEISLTTAEREVMVLETWCIRMRSKTDHTVTSNTAYGRISLMLKSLLCATRAVPAYALSRKQGPETYVICYLIYKSEPDPTVLGSRRKVRQVATVTLPTGTIDITVAFRSEDDMQIPVRTLRAFDDLKDDHFQTTELPDNNMYAMPKPCRQSYRDQRYVSDI